jgi:hypothetical protein
MLFCFSCRLPVTYSRRMVGRCRILGCSTFQSCRRTRRLAMLPKLFICWGSGVYIYAGQPPRRRNRLARRYTTRRTPQSHHSAAGSERGVTATACYGGKGALSAGKTRLFKPKVLLKPPERGRPGFAFLPPNERFQSFSAEFPSGAVTAPRMRTAIHYQAAARGRVFPPREAQAAAALTGDAAAGRRNPEEAEPVIALEFADDLHHAWRFREGWASGSRL